MRILFIIPEEFRGDRWGGVTTATITIANSLQLQGHEVLILTPGRRDASFVLRGVWYYKISTQTTKQILARKILYRGWKIFPALLGRLQWSWRVLQFVKQHGPFDIIEAPEWSGSSFFISLFSHQPVVIRLHRGWYFYLKDNRLPINLDNRFVCLLETACVALARGITSPSQFMLSQYKNIIFFKQLFFKTPVEVILYPIEVLNSNVNRSVSKQVFLLHIGRIEVAKGSDLLLEAFREISNVAPHLHVIMIGEDTQMYIRGKWTSFVSIMKDTIARYNLTQRVKILPRKTQSQLAWYYKHCQFYVNASRGNENCPLTVLDALNYGKAVIASKTGGLPEIITHKKNGLLYQQDNVHDLAGKILYLHTHDSVRSVFEQNNKKTIKTYDSKQQAQRTMRYYQALSAS